ncbi:MAG: putative ribosomal protein YlxQ [Firmicutes bacterium ADurb.Bin182]|nr:MAG: putative ribosomal protein YlxQ [Firmicutes bacterium ADurb.Bin182]
MNQTKFRSAVGFSMRAGRCIAGEAACEKAVKCGKAKLVLIDSGSSEKTLERWRGFCERAELTVLETEQLGSLIGKPGRKVAAILDKGFSDMITDAYYERRN